MKITDLSLKHKVAVTVLTELAGQVLRQSLRFFPRATVIGHADACSPLPKAMNRATRGVTVHAHTLRPCHALCERQR